MRTSIIVVLVIIVAIIGIACCFFFRKIDDFAEVLFENRSGVEIVSIELAYDAKHIVVSKTPDGKFQKIEIHTTFASGYNFKMTIKFADGVVLNSVEHAGPGDKVMIVIYKDSTSRALRQTTAW